MKQNGRVNALLVELLIVVLFFMLASTTLMEIFGAAKQNSTRAGVRSEALMQAQNLAETLYGADAPLDKLADMGFVQGADGWEKAEKLYSLIVTCWEEATEAGLLRRMEVSALYQGENLFTLPADRYIPGEVQP